LPLREGFGTTKRWEKRALLSPYQPCPTLADNVLQVTKVAVGYSGATDNLLLN